MHSEWFVGALGKNLEFGHLLRGQMEALFERQLQALHLPRPGELQELRTSVGKLEGQVEALQRRVGELSRTVERFAGPAAAPPEAPEPPVDGGVA